MNSATRDENASDASVSAEGRGQRPSRSELPGSRRLSIAVGIATAGRPAIVGRTIALLTQQTRLPDMLIACPASPADLPSDAMQSLPFESQVLSGKRGLTAQRNRILERSGGADIIVFFDDDFFPRTDYLEQLEAIFLQHPDVVAVTGRPIRDGANGPGVDVDTALELLSQSRPNAAPAALSETFGTYGCNMAFRMQPIRLRALTFYEALPLYGWQEDIDFSRQLAGDGRIVDASVLSGVHLGAKSGRTSGVRVGYSQIANPLYLIRKGTMSIDFAAPLIWRNVAANLAKSFWPEPWVDRKGRLKGNCLAVWDLLLGRMSPLRVLELE